MVDGTTRSDEFAGTRVVVSGATRGIGAAVVRRFVATGARVVAIARTGDAPAGADLVRADLSTPEGVRTAAAGALDHLGGLDVLVDNVGASEPVHDGLLAATDEHWQADLNVNLLSLVRLDRALVPHLTAQGGGAVIHVSSIAATMPQPDGIAYAAAKSAVETYSAGLAKVVGPHGVRVNVVRPGVIETGGSEAAMRASAEYAGIEPAELISMFEGRVALGRRGRPDEVVDAVTYLASARASYVTGAVLTVDGGLTIPG